MSASDKKLKPPCYVEVGSVNDLARLTCALERVALPMFRFTVKNEVILAVQLDLFRGTPVFYYVKNKDKGDFLGYRTAVGKEEVKLSGSTRDSVNAYAPIISVEKMPKIFEEGFFEKGLKRNKYWTMQVADLANLCKVALFKIMFEESPLPLFAFPKGNRWILGAFTRLDEADEAAIFFHITLNNRPDYSFVKYSSVNPEKTELTNRIDEHGYAYGKIIRLVETHPMVDI